MSIKNSILLLMREEGDRLRVKTYIHVLAKIGDQDVISYPASLAAALRPVQFGNSEQSGQILVLSIGRLACPQIEFSEQGDVVVNLFVQARPTQVVFNPDRLIEISHVGFPGSTVCFYPSLDLPDTQPAPEQLRTRPTLSVVK